MLNIKNKYLWVSCAGMWTGTFVTDIAAELQRSSLLRPLSFQGADQNRIKRSFRVT